MVDIFEIEITPNHYWFSLLFAWRFFCDVFNKTAKKKYRIHYTHFPYYYNDSGNWHMDEHWTVNAQVQRTYFRAYSFLIHIILSHTNTYTDWIFRLSTDNRANNLVKKMLCVVHILMEKLSSLHLIRAKNGAFREVNNDDENNDDKSVTLYTMYTTLQTQTGFALERPNTESTAHDYFIDFKRNCIAPEFSFHSDTFDVHTCLTLNSLISSYLNSYSSLKFSFPFFCCSVCSMSIVQCACALSSYDLYLFGHLNSWP